MTDGAKHCRHPPEGPSWWQGPCHRGSVTTAELAGGTALEHRSSVAGARLFTPCAFLKDRVVGLLFFFFWLLPSCFGALVLSSSGFGAEDTRRRLREVLREGWRVVGLEVSSSSRACPLPILVGPWCCWPRPAERRAPRCWRGRADYCRAPRRARQVASCCASRIPSGEHYLAMHSQLRAAHLNHVFVCARLNCPEARAAPRRAAPARFKHFYERVNSQAVTGSFAMGLHVPSCV